jgi:hypothetical protein
MIELLKLAKRCEQASGPDRELDAAISVALSDYENARVIWWKGNRKYLKPGPERIPMAVCFGRGVAWGMAFQTVRYTSSLDAATQLGEPRHVEWCDGFVEAVCFGDIFDSAVYTARAKTAPLALCAAALRAKASVDRSPEGQDSEAGLIGEADESAVPKADAQP